MKQRAMTKDQLAELIISTEGRKKTNWYAAQSGYSEKHVSNLKQKLGLTNQPKHVKDTGPKKQTVKDDTDLVNLIRKHRTIWSYQDYCNATGESKAFISARLRRLRLISNAPGYGELMEEAVYSGAAEFKRVARKYPDRDDHHEIAMNWIKLRFDLKEDHLKAVSKRISLKTRKARGVNTGGKEYIDMNSGFLNALRLPLNRIAEVLL